MITQRANSDSEFSMEHWALHALKTLMLALAAAVFTFMFFAPELIAVSTIGILVAGKASRILVISKLTLRGFWSAVFGWCSLWIALSLLLQENLALLTILRAIQTVTPQALILITDGFLVFGIASSVGLCLRFLALRYRVGTILELVFTVSAYAILLIQHQNGAIDRPHFLADWAVLSGYSPYEVIVAVGLLVALTSLVLALKIQFARSFVLGCAVLLLLGTTLYWARDQVIEQSIRDDSTTPQNMEQRLSQSQKPKPIAVALLHDDFFSEESILYFRQDVFSFYDGTRFTPEPTPKYDRDVFNQYPDESALSFIDHSEPGYRETVDISMFLLESHPEPIALSNAIKLKPRPNPQPQRFVAAYDTVSSSLSVPKKRLLGRNSIPKEWSDDQVKHYLTASPDPRYVSLAEELIEEADLRFFGDDLHKALMIKGYLEQNGFYTRTETHRGANDAAASFLFGNLKGYCVHFSHAAVHLLRSVGIASRVAVGYAADLRTRGEGSALILMANTAHAWPEIHLEGIGWIPFDIYPQQSDEMPSDFVQPSLESILGDMARNDVLDEERRDRMKKTVRTSIGELLTRVSWGLCVILLGLYFLRLIRALYLCRKSATIRQLYISILDMLSSYGYRRRNGETHLAFSHRVNALCPSLKRLTYDFQTECFGLNSLSSKERSFFRNTLNSTVSELRRRTTNRQKFFAYINPIAWWWTR